MKGVGKSNSGLSLVMHATRLEDDNKNFAAKQTYIADRLLSFSVMRGSSEKTA